MSAALDEQIASEIVQAPRRNEAMLAAVQESEQILNDMPVRGSLAKSLETLERGGGGRGRRKPGTRLHTRVAAP
jgi:hypothetical protein